jgi:hypothetical protein
MSLLTFIIGIRFTDANYSRLALSQSAKGILTVYAFEYKLGSIYNLNALFDCKLFFFTKKRGKKKKMLI